MSTPGKIAALRAELNELLAKVNQSDEYLRVKVQNEVLRLVKDAKRYLYPPPPNLPLGMTSLRNLNGEPLFCSECFQPQFQTRSGSCCADGHGGVPGIPAEDIPATKGDDK